MNLFSFIKSQLSIIDVVGEYVALKKAGLYYKASCPFHSEKTASFTVSPHKEIFYCFGCQSSGDVIAFIAKVEHCSQFEAAKHALERYSLQVPESLTREVHQADTHSTHKKRYSELCELVAQWCAHSLHQSPKALDYITKRGFTPETLRQFQIGYFPGGMQSCKNLISFVMAKKFLFADLTEAHILEQGKQVIYSPFEERLIFPIKDQLGRHCGFGGRIFKKEDERAKYYNSRENEFFSKGSLIFGFDLAKKAIQEQDAVCLVEGYTDCMAMVQHGYKNTVATLGTACTPEHLKLLSRHASKLFVLYDGDNAGEKAILRIADICWEVNMELMVIRLPPGEDPASLLTAGHSLEPHRARAQDIFMFYVETLGIPFSSLSLNEKLHNIQRLVQLIKTIGNSLKRDLVLQKASQVLGIPFDSLNNELQRAQPPTIRAAQSSGPKAELTNPEDLLQISLLEKKLFSVIMSNVTLVDKTNADYVIHHFSPPLRSILEKLCKGPGDESVDFVQFFDSLPPHEQKVITQLMFECEEENPTKTFEQLLVQFQKKHWKSIVHDIKIKLNEAEQKGDDHEIKELLSAFENLKKKIVKQGK